MYCATFKISPVSELTIVTIFYYPSAGKQVVGNDTVPLNRKECLEPEGTFRNL